MNCVKVGDVLTSSVHGGTATVVSIAQNGLTLRHPSGRERFNSWLTLLMWKAQSGRGRYGAIKQMWENTRQAVSPPA